MALTALPNKTAWTLVGQLCIAIGTHGKPKAIRTDNEAVFTSKVFTGALRLFDIRHQRTTPGCPWMNGRIERFFGTLKEKLDCWAVGNGDELKVALGHFHTWYAEIRPHAALGGATPLDAWNNVNSYETVPRSLELFEAWGGLLQGVQIRR